jgi:hypothetical protein
MMTWKKEWALVLCLLLTSGCSSISEDSLRYVANQDGTAAVVTLPDGGTVAVLRAQTGAGWSNDVVGMMPVVTHPGAQSTVGQLNMAVVPSNLGSAANVPITLGAAAVLGAVNAALLRNSTVAITTGR